MVVQNLTFLFAMNIHSRSDGKNLSFVKPDPAAPVFFSLKTQLFLSTPDLLLAL